MAQGSFGERYNAPFWDFLGAYSEPVCTIMSGSAMLQYAFSQESLWNVPKRRRSEGNIGQGKRINDTISVVEMGHRHR